MSVQKNIIQLIKKLEGSSCQLIAVTKTQPLELIQEIYQAGQRKMGENKVQEITEKQSNLPKDIEWHMIGHLQTNKVKYIAPFVHLIHSIDSLKLVDEIEKQAKKNNRTINCLLQIHIAQEETKFGFSLEEIGNIIEEINQRKLENIQIIGLMGMASNTENKEKIKNEFKLLRKKFEEIEKNKYDFIRMQELSMGMSHDYEIAIDEGSTMIRVGSAIFGERNL